MKTGFNRRAFLCSASAAGVFSILPRRLIAGSGEVPPSETVRFAAVGVGGLRGSVHGVAV